MISEIRARIYCYEDLSLIQNYAEAVADETQTWECHHRAEILPCGRYSQAQLKKHGLFKHVPASQLIFLTRAEHNRLHNEGNTNMLGKHHSEEAKAKIAAALKGKLKGQPAWNKGKHLSEETKAKLSAAMKGKPSPRKGKHLSEETRAKLAEASRRQWQKRRSENGCV